MASPGSSSDAAGKKRITQATFEETVRENMEEFEMDRPEAVADAVKQFTSQGVDLSNICITAHEGDEDWLAQVEKSVDALTAALDNGSRDELPPSLDAAAVLGPVQALQTAVEDSDTCRAGNAKKLLANSQGMNLVARLWACEAEAHEALVLASLALVQALLTPSAAPCSSSPSPSSSCLTAACDDKNGGGAAAVTSTSSSSTSSGIEGELRDQLWATGMLKLCEAAKRRGDDTAFLLAYLPVVRLLCTRAEDNKVHFARYGGLELLVDTLGKHGGDRDVVCEACGALRAVTAVDDFRKDFSASHTHTRALVSKGAVPLLVDAVRRFEGDLDMAVAGLACLKNLANNDESVGQIVANGGLEMTTAALQQHVENPAVARTAISVFRNVSADDKHKTALCNNGGAELMLKAMRKHLADGKLQEHALATIAAMGLRSPDNALKLAALGAVPATLQALRQHPAATAVQRQGCLAVRNLVSRNEQLVEAFLDAGAEPLLRQAGQYQESVDEAYAALRDLRCEVKRLVVDPATGKVRDAVEQFGSVKSSFRPCFETSNDVEARIEEVATAPAQGGYRF